MQFAHKILVLGATSLIALHAGAQTRTLESQEETKKFAEGVVASVAAGNYGAAWKELRSVSVVPPAEFDVFEAQFASQSPTVLARMGSPLGYELVREEKLGKFFVKYTFLVQHEKAPMRWMLVFYRGAKGWIATDFKFDGNAAALFGGG